MLAPVIKNNITQIKAICKEHKVKELYVFGSAARKDYQFYSDIDLLVDFEKEEDNNEFTDNYFWFKEELIHALKKPIDLLFYKKALKTRIKESINKDKILLYGRKTS
jgi:predicted nucleotidyltransferase